MYVLDYLIYHLRPYGIGQSYQLGITPDPPPDFQLAATPWPGPVTTAQELAYDRPEPDFHDFVEVEGS